jgi:CRP-like cAMP-binding protein
MSIHKQELSVVPPADQILPCLGHLKKLHDCRTLRVLPPQHIIFSQGESPQNFCFVCDGLVKLTRTESDGTRAIVGLRKKGWLLGAAPLLGEDYASTAETVTRSKLCFVPIGPFRHAMETDARFSQWVAMIFSRQVYSSVFSISERSSLSGRQRLEKFLWEMTRDEKNFKANKAVKIPIPLKLWEVAQLLALTPQHLCRLIKQMEIEGILLRKNGWLIIPEPKMLWDSGMA